MSYQYKDPQDRGYKKFNLTKEQHNEIFKNRKRSWTDKYDYYYKEDRIEIHKSFNWIAVILNTIIFPVNLLAYGITNYKEVWKDTVRLFDQKNNGAFVSAGYWKDESRFKQMMEIIKSESN
jgi:hypothetical protein